MERRRAARWGAGMSSTTAGQGAGDASDERSAYVREVVETLAADELQGRDNQTPGSAAAQEYLIGELAEFAEPVFPDEEGDDGYLQTYDEGANILAVIPGDELPDAHVMIGAHYDGKGNTCEAANCDDVEDDDDIYNGANDNAAGVAATLDIARAITADGPPRRSIVIALWDGEEDGLVGSRHYSDSPAIPPGQTVAYVNFDIQGANLLPSFRNHTILIGAETGGPNLIDSASRATPASTLDTVLLSLLFGEGRSDHTNLIALGVPAVFLTDANNGCYHSPRDDIDAADFTKLDQQIATAEALMRHLVQTDDVPALDPAAPPSTYDDAVELLRVISTAEPDPGAEPIGEATQGFSGVSAGSACRATVRHG